MTWGAVAGAAISVVGGYLANKSANKGNKAAANANQAAIDEQRREYDQSRQDQMPWLQFGQTSLQQLGALNNGDYSGFYNSPDYRAAQQMGLEALNRGLASQGTAGPGGYSGRADADRMAFGQNLATQYLGNYRSALQSGAGLGQTAANNLGTLGAGMATNIGNSLQNIGLARQSSYNNNAQFIAGTFGQIGNATQNYLARRNSSPQWY